MPIREYVCNTTQCKNKDSIKELLVGMNEVPNCERCKEPLKQIITEGPAGFVRGSRFYCPKEYK